MSAPESMRGWQEYAIACNSYVESMWSLLGDGQRLLRSPSEDDGGYLTDVEELLSDSSIGAPHGLELLVPASVPVLKLPELPLPPPGTPPDWLYFRGDAGELHKRGCELRVQIEDHFKTANADLSNLRTGIAASDPEAIRRLMRLSHTRHKLPAFFAKDFDVDIDFLARVALCTVEIPDFTDLEIVKQRRAVVSVTGRRQALDTILYSLCLPR